MVPPPSARSSYTSCVCTNHPHCPRYGILPALLQPSIYVYKPIIAVRALYDRKRWVTVCMLVVFGLQVISAAVAGAILLPRISVDATCFPANNDTLRVIYDMVTMCDNSIELNAYMSSRTKQPFLQRAYMQRLAMISMPPLALEVLMFILTTCMAQKTARDLGWNSQIPLLKLLIRDGSWACILVFGSSCCSVYC